MQGIKRILAVLLLLTLMPLHALCEAHLVPQLEEWRLGTQPVQVRMTAQAEAVDEFDENRVNQLNALLKHIAFTLQFQETANEQWGSVAIDVDGETALALTVNETAEQTYAQLSCVPDVTYTAPGGDVGVWLLGGEETNSVLTLEGLTSPWLTACYDMFDILPNVFAEYTEEKKVDTSISKMGTAKLRQTITIPAEEAPRMAETCSAPEVADALANAVFSGEQKVTIFRNANGAMIKVTYSGRVGADADSLRKVSLTWTMRREDSNTRDDITLKTPSVNGKDYNTITFKRTETIDENGTVDLYATLEHKRRLNDVRTVETGKADLVSAPVAEGTRLTGTVSRSVAVEDDDTQWLILEPDLVFAASDVSITGTAAVETRTEKRTEARYVLSLEMTYGSYFEWLLHENTVLMDDSDAAASAREALTAAVSTALIRPLVLLPYEDTLYLSDGLDTAVWESIVEQARKAIQ